MVHPIDIAVRHSVDFIADKVPANAAILEIGCGEGGVAQQLNTLGYSVTAIDADAEAVAAAQAKGVDARVGQWPCDPGGVFDAITFTRSLHHIHNLEGAIAAAKKALRDSGVFILEDFAFDEADDRTIAWFSNAIAAPSVAPLLNPQADSFLARINETPGSSDAWRHDHDHDLHSFTAMKRAVHDAFEMREVAGVPYLYRYLIDALPKTTAAVETLETFFHNEAAAIEAGEITAIGRRIVAQKLTGEP